MSKERTSEPVAWDKALATILGHSRRLAAESLPLDKACRRVVARQIVSGVDVPPFDNSSMDGYAVRSEDVATASAKRVELRVFGVSAAGKPWDQVVQSGTATEIMTGAVIPDGADAVIRVEDTERCGDHVLIRKAAAPGQYIRRRGADTSKGGVIARPGQAITPALAGLLASCGEGLVDVVRRPRVALVNTGDELVRPDETLQPGQIYDSGSVMLESLLKQWGCEVRRAGLVQDDPEILRAALMSATDCDIVITVGGVSMGRFDYVRPALRELGATEHFWRVNQQPGGPMLFAILRDTLIFGLPGNPVSSFVCANVYVKAAVAQKSGQSGEHVFMSAKLIEPLRKPHSKTAFVRGVLQRQGGEWLVQSTGAQDSNLISSLVDAHGYIIFDAEKRQLDAGEIVRFLLTDLEAIARMESIV